MQKSNAPTKLTVVFASGTGAGPVNTVPLAPGATPGTASYQTGFTTVNMEPIASGGVPPFGADFNGLFKAATTAQIWQQAGYTWTFDSTFAGNANIGGYPAGAVLLMGDGKGLWINQTDNNAVSPDNAGASGWIGLPAAGVSTIATTGGTTTPDPSVLGVTTLLVAGTLTSNATLVLPLDAGSHWIVANNTTGSFTLTVKGATGAGVSITQGSALTVFTDGTNYFAASANISGAYLPIDGTAVAATKLATSRNFSVTGMATASSVSFNGTGNVSLNVTSLTAATPAQGAKADSAIQPDDDATLGSISIDALRLNVTAGGRNIGYIWSSAPNNGFWDFDNSVWILRFDGNNTANFSSGGAAFAGNVSVNGSLTATTANFTSSDRRLKRNIRKIAPRPLHRNVRFVGYTLKESGWYGLGSIAQNAKRYAPEHVGTFKQDGKTYLSLNYAGMAYEQAMWAGQEVDRLTKRVAKLERALDCAKIEPRKRGFARRLLEAIW